MNSTGSQKILSSMLSFESNQRTLLLVSFIYQQSSAQNLISINFNNIPSMSKFATNSKPNPKRPKQNNKTPTKIQAEPLRNIPPSSHSKQIQSRIQYAYQSQQNDFNIDKLDLIFQKQHKDIQQKLVKLLLTYNAVLQYNKDTDMFQVDLLLPFINDQQKKEFVRKFLEIRRSKTTNRVAEGFLLHQNQKSQKKGNVAYEGYASNMGKQQRKFSFNTNYNQKQQQKNIQNEGNEQQQNQSIIQQSSNYNQEEERDAEQDYKSHHQHSILSELKNQELNMPAIEEMIKNKLKKAINIINLKKGKGQRNENNANSILINDDEQKEEQSFITKFIDSNSYPLRQQNERIITNGFIKVDDEQNQHNPYQKSQKQKQQKFNKSMTYNSGQIYENVIDEQYEQEDNQPLFDKKIVVNKSEKITTFQEYNNRYNTLKQQKNEKKMPKKVENSNRNRNNEVQLAKNYYSSKEKQQKNLLNQSSNSIKKIQNKGKGQQAKGSSSANKSVKKDRRYESITQQKFKDFFQHHKKHLQSIYSDIRNKIKTKEKVISKPKSTQKPQRSHEKSPSLQKKSQDLFILVQDDEDSQEQLFEEEIQSKKLFKNEVFQSYKKQIIVNNKNLSSEDLIRYFRYLHSNAKKLYLKYNKSIRK